MSEHFDALVEGSLHASNQGDGSVKLWRVYPEHSTEIAHFHDLGAFSLLFGYVSTFDFNDAMDKRREQWKLITKEKAIA